MEAFGTIQRKLSGLAISIHEQRELLECILGFAHTINSLMVFCKSIKEFYNYFLQHFATLSPASFSELLTQTTNQLHSMDGFVKPQKKYCSRAANYLVGVDYKPLVSVLAPVLEFEVELTMILASVYFSVAKVFVFPSFFVFSPFPSFLFLFSFFFLVSPFLSLCLFSVLFHFPFSPFSFFFSFPFLHFVFSLLSFLKVNQDSGRQRTTSQLFGKAQRAI
jgi:hypothetical protein